MARNITGKEFDRNKYVLQHNNGGSGCINIKELSAKFGIITENEINQPGGILGYDANGKIPSSIVGDTSDSTIINGPTAINVLQTAQYTIVNYSSTTTYNITFNGGTWTRTGNTITVTAGNSVGTYTLNVNGTVTNISVVSFGPNKPTVVVSGINIVTGARLSISTNAYSSTNGSTHGSTSWQVATDAAFTNIIYQSVDNATNKTNIVTDVGNYTTYYVRARFKDQYNVYGLWSEVVSINKSSMSTTIATPSLTAESIKVTNGAKFTITGTAYADSGGGTHSSTVWQIAGDASFTDIVYNNTDTTNKTSNVITVTSIKTTYYIRAKYVANNNVESSWSAAKTFNYSEIPAGIPKNEEAKLEASDKATSDYFGYSVSISSDGSRVIVGAYGKNSYTGVAYIFSRSGATWTQEAKLEASDKATNIYFGYSVSISGDGSRVIAGALGKISLIGAVYIFTRSGTTWTQEAKLEASDKAINDYFGYSVSISSDGSRVIVGAYGKISSTGAAYIFSRSGTTWTQEAKLEASDKATNDYFGWNVSISSDGSRVIVGAHGKNSYTGVAYIFTRSGTTWTQEAKLEASDKATNDYFGWNVSISSDGSRAIVGAYNKASGKGASYIFSRSGATWTQEAKLQSSDKAADDRFGIAVSISSDGSRVIVGAYGNTSSTGAAYIFSRSGTTWTQEAKLQAGDPSTGDYFGDRTSISSDGSRVIVGVYNKASGTGAAYIYS